MPLDALCLAGVVRELNTALSGARVDKIYQPARDEVIMALRGQGGNVRLLLSANPSRPRPQLTGLPRENPDKPPMFCMLLRKHLSGARLLEIKQVPMERVVDIKFETLDELGDRVERRLVLEAISRRANLLLLDEEGRILDCIRRVDSPIGGKGEAFTRIVQPGMLYRLPPALAKENPALLDREGWLAVLEEAPGEYRADQWLLDRFGGLSPLVCREMACRAGGRVDITLFDLGQAGRERLASCLLALLAGEEYAPTLISIGGKLKDFTFLVPVQYEEAELLSFPTFSALLDRFYEQRDSQERVKQKGQDLIRSVTNARDRAARKLARQETELASARDRERLRQLGDIITANFYAMSRGMVRLRAQNFYDPEGGEIDVPLDPLLTPQQNAARYYREYNKAKRAEEMLTLQLEKGRADLDYLNSVLGNISLAEGERDLQEIRQELTDAGYLRRQSRGKKEKRLASRPMEFRSTAGLRISVGKNNTQNDLLTCKQAFKSDIWFHAQKIHGSHVILWTEGKAPDLQSLNEAAALAAWFSQARESSRVPVDYTPVKYVKKPAGARPGMVVYTTYETAWVTPDGELAKRLRVKK